MQVRNGYGINGFTFTSGTTLGILIDNESQLRIYINGYDLGVAATGLPTICHAVFDLNGRCEEISVISRGLESDSNKIDIPLAQRQESQQEKADLEIQEKYPEQAAKPEKSYKIEIKRRNSKELTKIEQKLSSSDSYNSGIQQISSQAASCSFQSDTDNFNTQIQQLTMDLKSDLQRSQADEEGSVMTNSDTYNTELQMLSARSNSQINFDSLNMQIQQLTTSNSGSEISTNLPQNIPHSQSQPFLAKNQKEAPKNDEKIDEVKEIERNSSPVSSPVIEEEESAHDVIVYSNIENMSDSRNSLKNNSKTRKQTASRQMNVSSQNLRNCQSSIRRNCDYFTSCSRFKNMLGLPGMSPNEFIQNKHQQLS